jgi:hypothetical protein
MKPYTKKMLESELWIMSLWGVTVLCLVFAGAYVFRYRAFLNAQVQFDPNSLSQTDPNEAELKAYVAKDQNVMEAMKAENLFVKAPPKTNPVTDVDIIGHEALINGKLFKVGDKVGDAKVTAITARGVTVEWNGASTTFSPINGPDQGGGSKRPGQRPGRPSRSPSSASRNRPKRTAARSSSGPQRGGNRTPTPEQMKAFQRMSPQEQKTAMKEWMKNNR